jgi:hypothetical protein
MENPSNLKCISQWCIIGSYKNNNKLNPKLVEGNKRLGWRFMKRRLKEQYKQWMKHWKDEQDWETLT